ncbi:MAG: hypothetical protein WC511_00210 [Candidatus Pacearchaeota archaeon]
MKKSEFEEIEKNYLERRKSLEKISVGDLVWEEASRFWDTDYHPAIVKSVNIDEDYIDIIDVSDGNKEKRYVYVGTEEDMLRRGFSKEDLDLECQKYIDIINRVKKGLI